MAKLYRPWYRDRVRYVNRWAVIFVIVLFILGIGNLVPTLP